VPSNHTSSAPAVSQPVDPAIFAQVQAAASAPGNPEPPARASSASTLSGMVDRPAVSGNVDRPAVSGMVDYGPCREYWLKYSFVQGLEKKKNSQSTTSSQASNHSGSHEGTTGANVRGPRDKSGAPPGAQLAPPVGSVGDQVVQGSVVAGEVGAPLDARGVESNRHASHEGMSRDPMTEVELIPVHNLLLWLVLLVTKWFKAVLLLVKLELLRMQWEW